MEERVIKLNYLVLTICYMFGFFYVVQGLIYHNPKFTMMRLPSGIQCTLQKILIILGVNSTLIVSVGCRAMRGNLLFLAWHAISSTVILSSLIATSVFIITQLGEMSNIIYADLRELIDTYEVNPANRYIMDTFQRKNNCCGIHSIDDWFPLHRIPETCYYLNRSLPLLQEKVIEPKFMNESIFAKEMHSEFIYSNGCYSAYKQFMSNNFTILLVIFIINSLLMGISIFIESFFFVESALNEEERCNAVIAASRTEQRQIIRQRNRTKKLFEPAPTQCNASVDNIEFTKSEENIVYPKSKLTKFFQKLFEHRNAHLRGDPNRRAVNREDNYQNDMIHWMHYF